MLVVALVVPDTSLGIDVLVPGCALFNPTLRGIVRYGANDTDDGGCADCCSGGIAPAITSITSITFAAALSLILHENDGGLAGRSVHSLAQTGDQRSCGSGRMRAQNCRGEHGAAQ
jgi:hypothetical protein